MGQGRKWSRRVGSTCQVASTSNDCDLIGQAPQECDHLAIQVPRTKSNVQSPLPAPTYLATLL